ncbi:hypothetical protein [Gemmata sp.]|uniref:hypothetical protein n=1 Tax=Gemmata sp. TaxID=1914242 RepID=UPI003F6FA7FC
MGPRCLRLVAAAVLAAPLAGCGPGAGEVAGRVTFRGRPVTGGSVVLFCPGKRIARGVLGPDGAYAIPNVPAGDAAVALRFSPPADAVQMGGRPLRPDELPPGPPLGIPPRYTVPEESGLAVRVTRGRVVYDIELSP